MSVTPPPQPVPAGPPSRGGRSPLRQAAPPPAGTGPSPTTTRAADPADPAPPSSPEAGAVRARVRAADTAEILATTLLGLSIWLRATGGTDPQVVTVCAGLVERALAELPRLVRDLADAHPDHQPGNPEDWAPPEDLVPPEAPAAGHLPPLAAPVMPRLFFLYRRTDRTGGLSGTGVVAVGIELPEVPAGGPRVITIWRGIPTGVWNLTIWQSIDEILTVHGHDHATGLHWLYRPPDNPAAPLTHSGNDKEQSTP